MNALPNSGVGSLPRNESRYLARIVRYRVRVCGWDRERRVHAGIFQTDCPPPHGRIAVVGRHRL